MGRELTKSARCTWAHNHCLLAVIPCSSPSSMILMPTGERSGSSSKSLSLLAQPGLLTCTGGYIVE